MLEAAGEREDPALSARNRLIASGSSVWSALGANTSPCGLLSSSGDRSRTATSLPDRSNSNRLFGCEKGEEMLRHRVKRQPARLA